MNCHSPSKDLTLPTSSSTILSRKNQPLFLLRPWAIPHRHIDLSNTQMKHIPTDRRGTVRACYSRQDLSFSFTGKQPTAGVRQLDQDLKARHSPSTDFHLLCSLRCDFMFLDVRVDIYDARLALFHGIFPTDIYNMCEYDSDDTSFN